MRIITGTAKGTKLAAPKGFDVRPTADRVKESLFNILGDAVIEAKVIDMFAGTGNLGLEAVSRGAYSATFVEQNLNSIRFIRQNAERTKLTEKVKIIHSDVLNFLGRSHNELYDIVFCDPPYNKGFLQAVLSRIDNMNFLAKKGLIIFEHAKHEIVPDNLTNLELVRSQQYGETIISFFRLKY